jgi:large subunit ribosomal protein L37Ae
MGRTKKVGIAGKYGARYGIKIRSKIVRVEEKKTKECPYCKKKALKRTASGIWECRRCNAKFAGGTHIPISPDTTQD